MQKKGRKMGYTRRNMAKKLDKRFVKSKKTTTAKQ
jgi:hypothetical protein